MKVIVRYAAGRVVKGFARDFLHPRDRFDLYPLDAPDGEPLEIFLDDLKAVFFVRDFVGDAAYDERMRYAEGENPSGEKVKVTFLDGEVMIGSTLNYDPDRPGFFLIPVDPRSNNIQTYVVFSAIKKVLFL